jgi:5-(carboxyamino)imidazole ribonucleotide mutase
LIKIFSCCWEIAVRTEQCSVRTAISQNITKKTGEFCLQLTGTLFEWHTYMTIGGHMNKVGIIMGSDSDLPELASGCAILEKFGVAFEIAVSSAHRTPEETKQWVSGAGERGIKVIIAAAGGAAHLPGVVASYTTLPVVGVPIASPIAGGLDSLLSIVQMPSGIPVGTMAAGKSGASNAALYALSILALIDAAIAEKLVAYRKEMADGVRDKNARLQKKGYKDYIKTMK